MPLPPPPGRLVDVGTHRLHLRCEGAGTPTVVFDAALGASSLSWSLVQPAVAGLTRACSYDRAGFGWSDAGPMPRTAGRMADELWRLLTAAQLPPPYVLVGHSFGGLVTRLAAARHPEAVAALVLIEPAIPEQWAGPSEAHRALIERGARLCRYGAAAARSGLATVVAGLVALGALGPARALVRIISRGGLGREDEGILAPIWKLPPPDRAVLRHMWVQPKFFDALGSQIAHVDRSAREVLEEAVAGPSSLPLLVMTSAAATAERLQADRDLARSSSRGRHILVDGAGHWIPLDAPQAVAEAITSLVERLRSSPPCAPE